MLVSESSKTTGDGAGREVRSARKSAWASAFCSPSDRTWLGLEANRYARQFQSLREQLANIVADVRTLVDARRSGNTLYGPQVIHGSFLRPRRFSEEPPNHR